MNMTINGRHRRHDTDGITIAFTNSSLNTLRYTDNRHIDATAHLIEGHYGESWTIANGIISIIPYIDEVFIGKLFL